LANALKPLTSEREKFVLPEEWGGMRAEQIPVADYLILAKSWVESK
jgi:hypothetical protein